MHRYPQQHTNAQISLLFKAPGIPGASASHRRTFILFFFYAHTYNTSGARRPRRHGLYLKINRILKLKINIA
jgi:hypothetical protein